MKKQSVLAMTTSVLAGALMLSCSPVKVQSLNAIEYGKVSAADDVIVAEPQGERPTLPPSVEPLPPVVGVPEASMDPREIRCKGISPAGIPAVIFDSRAATGAAPTSIKGFVGGKTIEAETVSSVSNFIGNIKVIAASIGKIEGFATSSAEFNAQKIGELQGFAAGQVEVVTHELTEAKNFAGDFCASAQSIGSITNLASRLSLFGRGENGQRAKLGRLGNVAGFISIYNFDIGGTEPLSGAAIKAKLVNSHLTKLENAAVDMILVDSVIDEVANVAGVIHLKGNSKVLKRDGSALQIITEK